MLETHRIFLHFFRTPTFLRLPFSAGLVLQHSIARSCRGHRTESRRAPLGSGLGSPGGMGGCQVELGISSRSLDTSWNDDKQHKEKPEKKMKGLLKIIRRNIWQSLESCFRMMESEDGDTYSERCCIFTWWYILINPNNAEETMMIRSSGTGFSVGHSHLAP